MERDTLRLRVVLLLITGIVAAWVPGAQAATYYVNPSSGNDSANGSSSSPWRTINKAKSSVNAGDTVILMPGSYGSVTFGSSDRRGTSSSYITYRSSSPHQARFSRILFSGSTDFYITVEGLDVENTGANDAAIKVENGRYVRVINCKAHGRSGGAGPTWANIYIKSGRNVLIEDCEVYYSGKSAHGIQMETADTVTVRGCHVHDIVSSGIRTSDGQNYVFEYNIVHDQRADWDPSVHGSGFSIHSHNTTIRGNIIYNYGNTRPIRFYQSWAGANGYKNMLVENNLVYEIPDWPGTQWWTEFIDVGPNNVIRNNTFIGDVTITFASNADGSGLSVYNNIITGKLQLESTGKWAKVKHGGNVMNQLAASGCGWMCFYDNINSSGSNKIGGINFNSGFFRTGAAEYPYTNGYPFQLASGAAAVNYSVSSQAPSTDLLKRGRVGTPDAGCFEYGATGSGGSGGNDGGGSEPANKAPVAKAGDDQTVVDSDGDGKEPVTLDGSASTDPEGKIASYVWKEGTKTLASDVNPTVELTVGQHTITLTVTDDKGLTASDNVIVTVEEQDSVLKAFWMLNEKSGTTAADSSDNKNTGTLINGPQWNGYGVLNFDGVDDYVTCGTNASLNLTGSLTISACINPASFGGSGYGRIVDKGSATTGFSFFIEEASQALVYVPYGGNLVRSTSNVVKLNTWQHVAVTYDKTAQTVTFYVDGKPAGSSSYATSPASSASSPVTIGIRGSDKGRAFKGAISAVRLYSVALGADAIKELYNEDYPFALAPIGDKEVEAGSTLTFELQTALPDVTLAIQSHNLPSAPTLKGNVFTWTAGASDAGTYEVTFSATHGTIHDSETIKITVREKPKVVNGLVGRWRFDEMSGSTAADSSSSGNVGTLKGGPVWTTGQSGGALSFDGQDACVDCGAGASLNLTNSLTITAWIRPTTFGSGGFGRIVDKGDARTGFSFFVNQYHNGLTYVIYGGNLVNSNANVITMNKWQQVAVVYDRAANEVRFYVDGKEAGTSTYTTPPAAAASRPLYIGIRGVDQTRAFNGLIDDVCVYNKALTAAEIQGNPTSAPQGPQGPVEVIIDNGDPGTSYTGTWEVSGGSNPYGADSVWSRDGDIYTWTFRPSVSGTYTLSMWWSGWPSRSASVPVIIMHDEGWAVAYINQQQNAGQWNEIGKYTFTAETDYTVTMLSQPAPASTCADAIKFTR